MPVTQSDRDAVLESIRNLEIISIDRYARDNIDAIRPLYESGIIDDESIEAALVVAIFRRVERDYWDMTDPAMCIQEFADHIGSPSCMAYAIHQGHFSDDDLERIPFDHGQTIDTYLDRFFNPDLPERYRKNILNPRPLPKEAGHYDPHPACCHH